MARSISARTVDRIAMGVVAVAAVSAFGAAAATGAFGKSSDQVSACVKSNGSVRVVSAAGSCRKGERPVSWGQRGAQGPAGPVGPAGPAGPVGPAGLGGSSAGSPPPGCQSAEAPTTPPLALFAQIPGITGESRDERRKDQIDLTGVTFNLVGPTARCAASSPDVVITKRLDTASPRLAAAVSSGAPIGDVRIEGVRAGGQGPLVVVYELTGVVATSMGHASNGGVPAEAVGLRYATMTITYRRLDDKGTLGSPVVTTVTPPPTR